jgi:transposase
MLQTLHVGIDLRPHRHDVCLRDERGTALGRSVTVVNNRPGAAELSARVAAVAADDEPVLLGLEATGISGWPLARTLAQAAEVAPHQPRVVVFPPRLIQGFRGADRAMDQTDPDEAGLIAERRRFGHRPHAGAPDPRAFPLQRLRRYRFHLVHPLGRTKAHALTLRCRAASEYDRLEPCSDRFGATSLAVLTEFTGVDDRAAVPLEELTTFIDPPGRHRFATPSAPARRRHQVAADACPLDEDAVEPVHFALTHALAHIRFLTQQRKPLERRRAQERERFPPTRRSIPGIGPVDAAGLIAEIGEVTRFPNDDALAKYAGRWWPRRQAGQFEAEDRPLAKAGNA